MPNNNAIIEAFLNERTNHLYREHARIAALRKSVPALSELDDARAAAKQALFREKIAENPDADAHYAAAREKIAAEESRILAANHIAPEELKIHYLCDKCRDTGYVGGHPCDCLKKVLNDAAFSRYDLTPQAKAQNFSAFDLNYYDGRTDKSGRNVRTYMTLLLNRMKKYCADFDAVQDNYLFSGNPGLGKTFLSNCVACDLIEQGYQVVYISAGHLIDLVRDNMRARDGSVRRIYRGLLDCDLLIIDDLGAEYHTRFSDDQLFEIINSRILKQGKMIISSNLTPKEIQQQYNKRLASRINGYFTVLRFQGDDIRNIKKSEQRRAEKK